VETECNLTESSKDGHELKKGCVANDGDDDSDIGLETARAMKRGKPMKSVADVHVSRS
jgi:hypothetical protein